MKEKIEEEIKKLERKLFDNTHRNGITFAGMTSGIPLTKKERLKIKIKLWKLKMIFLCLS